MNFSLMSIFWSANYELLNANCELRIADEANDAPARTQDRGNRLRNAREQLTGPGSTEAEKYRKRAWRCRDRRM